eukprot:TRINITY_DN1310_c0_g1_i1.p1 TRINITY_DN1310_c0_g1~~TRINITY_DN1310_c0_g1_i1.p1  ORF type:complete len:245 (+),score=53.89 TRINITY_DN1310_c0_g1_i1:332-1066(+)
MIENCLKVDDQKAFEKFNAFYLLLILQCKSYLCLPLPLNESKSQIQFNKKETTTVRELLLNKITNEKYNSLLDLEINLLDEKRNAFIYQFEEDDDRPYIETKQPGRSLENKFSKDLIKFNTFYLSSLLKEGGIEGIILLPLTNGETLLISLQTKLRFQDTVSKSYVYDIDKVHVATKKLASSLSEMGNKIHHFLPILITNKAISDSENASNVVIIKDQDYENFLGFSFSQFPFLISKFSSHLIN